jgi:ubiquinone/menaquinone biosynthesis C-methylase UbiE
MNNIIKSKMTTVKDVYNNIARDFSRTRYTVWDQVKIFLDSLPMDTLLADIGCGNGKNMMHRDDIKHIGVDLCESFIKICEERKLNVRHGSVLDIPLESNSVDNTICIAVIHHLKTIEERVKAISELIRITKPGGLVMIYVWCFEQDSMSKNKFKTQDEMVPFKDIHGTILSYRFYHLYINGEIEIEISMINEKTFKYKLNKVFKDRNNYVIILQKLS